MIRLFLHKAIASALGIGKMGKGGGTAAAAVFCIAWYFISTSGVPHWLLPACVVFITGIGVWSSAEVEQSWGKDSKYIVVDEMAGMGISMLFVPVSISTLLVGFALFRFFDIAKPLYIKKTEHLKGGYGVMMDDVLAGLYSNIILQLAVVCRLFDSC